MSAFDNLVKSCKSAIVVYCLKNPSKVVDDSVSDLISAGVYKIISKLSNDTISEIIANFDGGREAVLMMWQDQTFTEFNEISDDPFMLIHMIICDNFDAFYPNKQALMDFLNEDAYSDCDTDVGDSDIESYDSSDDEI